MESCVEKSDLYTGRFIHRLQAVFYRWLCSVYPQVKKFIIFNLFHLEVEMGLSFLVMKIRINEE